MPSYRLEEASSSRAGCQNKECKEQKLKIQKGELRHGTWVETERIKSFMWRHWGCVTPKIISNLNETIEELSGDKKDPEAIDGFEDLAPENQERVMRALKQGHVDDDEWNGDPEMNRPGKVGFRVRGGKKDVAAKDDDETEEKPEPKAKKRKDAGEKEKPTPKPKRSRKSKAAVESEDSEEEELSDEPKPKKARGRPARATAEKKAPKAKASKKKAESDDDEAESPVEKPKRGRKKKST
ncbi:poly polymerase and DNA-ligase Zn-finger region-domain-containing protein [Aspergillus ambiguus]|uniref:uncharacterized protein n=1 Tax=Aspergillus ambiguus TaxID=176160 RepID=UPI003CCDB8B6